MRFACMLIAQLNARTYEHNSILRWCISAQSARAHTHLSPLCTFLILIADIIYSMHGIGDVMRIYDARIICLGS